jgi:predicted nucleic acid-binding protein
MGALTLPASGLVYIDTMTLIYTVERYPAYLPLLEPMWQIAQTGSIEIVSSELTLMEALVGPLRSGNTILKNAFEQALLGTNMRLIPITQAILREAARLRATTRLRTPDALHAATAQQTGCALFVTNDAGFRGMVSVPLVILDDLLTL